MEAIINIIESLKKTDNLNGIKPILEKHIDEFEMEYFLFGLSVPQSVTKTHIHIIDNFPVEWRTYYEKNSLAKKDPTVLRCLKQHRPVVWSELIKKDYTKDEWAVLEQGRKAGLATGFTIPIHGMGNQFGMLSMASPLELDDDIVFNSMVKAQSIVPVIQDLISKLSRIDSAIDVRLTPREIECIRWAAEGKSGWEMSVIMGCSERTTLFHMKNIGRKLNSTNRYQSVAKSILLGYIEPNLTS